MMCIQDCSYERKHSIMHIPQTLRYPDVCKPCLWVDTDLEETHNHIITSPPLCTSGYTTVIIMPAMCFWLLCMCVDYSYVYTHTLYKIEWRIKLYTEVSLQKDPNHIILHSHEI